jgi:hypothetical protein
MAEGGKVRITAGGQPQTLDGDRAKSVMELFAPMKVTGDPALMRVTAVVSVDGRVAYEVEGGNRRYDFDLESGLLVRRVTLTETLLGPMPSRSTSATTAGRRHSLAVPDPHLGRRVVRHDQAPIQRDPLRRRPAGALTLASFQSCDSAHGSL